jgi:hypothetical protein
MPSTLPANVTITQPTLVLCESSAESPLAPKHRYCSALSVKTFYKKVEEKPEERCTRAWRRGHGGHGLRQRAEPAEAGAIRC